MNFSYKQNIILMVRSLYFCMDEHRTELANAYNISPAQQHILFILTTNQHSLTPSEISEIGCWHVSTVTRLLKPLKERGFITVTRDPYRPRYKNVTITTSGNVIFQRIIRTIQEQDFFPFEMSSLTKDELETFLQVGNKILDANKGTSFRKKVFDAKIEGIEYV